MGLAAERGTSEAGWTSRDLRDTLANARHELDGHGNRVSAGSARMGDVSDLIDTTEMYLKSIYELQEEGIVPLRARIAERLHQSGPTVSQTVARMERDGLLTVEGDRHLELSEEGRRLAMRVMRKHRLAERLLTDVIGLDIELVHDEACRWEHVISETVERRLVELLNHPTESPYGNPIPGLDELGEATKTEEFLDGVITLTDAVKGESEPVRVVVRRISEPLQTDPTVMAVLRRVGALPEQVVLASAGPEGVIVARGGETAELDEDAAVHVFVRAF
jgi:DtxR family Mn-dependent transcriptional regulator